MWALERLRDERLQRRVLLVLALALRLLYLALQDPHADLWGGDGPWYLRQGWLIAHRALPAPLAIGPLYPLLLAALWLGFPHVPDPVEIAAIPAAWLTLVRLVQIALSVLTVDLGYRLARRLTGEHRAGMLAALGLGLGPAFVMEPFNILTETLFMALLTVGVWRYVAAQQAPSTAGLALAGCALGLAALTRPVLLLLPVVLIAHLLALQGLRAGMKWSGVLVTAFALTLAPWSVYLSCTTERWLPPGLTANLWIGATPEGRWVGSARLDSMRRQFRGSEDDYGAEALRLIGADPLGWLGRRGRLLAEAVLQPHGTVNLSGPGIKQAFAAWLRGDRALGGLGALLHAPGFWPKAALHTAHWVALTFGAVGVWVYRRRWREYGSLYGAMVYLAVAYGVLTVLPRYLFPAEIFLWVLAGAGLAAVGRRGRRADRGDPCASVT